MSRNSMGMPGFLLGLSCSVISLAVTACAVAPPPTASPSPSVLAPVNKAREVTEEAQQKALEQERLSGKPIKPAL